MTRHPDTDARTARALRAAWLTAALCLGLVLPAVLALLIDPRLVANASPWVKPLKFALSFALHWLTIAIAIERLSRPVTSGLSRAVHFGALATLIEIGAIVLQSARGVPSHFNRSTPLDAAIYFGVMGPAALVIVAATFVVGWCLHADVRARWPGAAADAEPSVIDRALALGLMLSAVLTLFVAAPMAAGVTASPETLARREAAALPLVGWSGLGGDLRVAHFFATHMAQALPLFAWLAHRFRPLQRLLRLNAIAAVGAGLILALALQALLDRPFISIATHP